MKLSDGQVVLVVMIAILAIATLVLALNGPA